MVDKAKHDATEWVCDLVQLEAEPTKIVAISIATNTDRVKYGCMYWNLNINDKNPGNVCRCYTIKFRTP